MKARPCRIRHAAATELKPAGERRVSSCRSIADKRSASQPEPPCCCQSLRLRRGGKGGRQPRSWNSAPRGQQNRRPSRGPPLVGAGPRRRAASRQRRRNQIRCRWGVRMAKMEFTPSSSGAFYRYRPLSIEICADFYRWCVFRPTVTSNISTHEY